jgi:uncharacterized membrane protein YdjX (TVP38/TMEM64 family)
MPRPVILRITAFVVLVAIGAATFWLAPWKEWLGAVLVHVQAMGPWGPVGLAVVYVLATVLFIPGWILSVGAGFAFGVVRGTIAVSLGSTLGASAAWLLGRTLARGVIERRVAGNPRFRAIDEAIGQHGFKIVLLLRLSPAFPFNLLNYALGLTRVSFRDYVLASWIGMLPATVMIVYIGSTLRSLTDVMAGEGKGGHAQKVLLAVGLAATIAVTVLVTRVARKALRSAVPSVDPDQATSAKPND